MPSIIIAAHNEENVIGATLDALLSGTDRPGLQIIVVPNGCTDRTADVARARPGVEVVEIEVGSKPAALNAGEAVAATSPRIYLDADIIVPPGGLNALEAALGGSTLAAVPGRRLILDGRPWPVRAYFSISERLPAFAEGLFGRGMIALSSAGRARFDTFPSMVADDMFLDAHFTADEKAHVREVEVRVETPYTTRDLMRRLVRVRRGLRAIRQAGLTGSIPVRIRESDRWSWLRNVVLREPRLLPAAVVYVAITLMAGAVARRGDVSSLAWGRDESTRRKARPN